MDQLVRLYHYPMAIVVATAIGGIGYKVFAILTTDAIPVGLFIMIAVEMVELSYLCGIGTVVDVCVSAYDFSR